jgi:hypothetical protein
LWRFQFFLMAPRSSISIKIVPFGKLTARKVVKKRSLPCRNHSTGVHCHALAFHFQRRRLLVVAWKELAKRPESELSRVDIAIMNLACAEGLSGSERTNAEACQRTLDAWAEKVRWQTLKHFRRFEYCPDEFHRSEAYFRALVLITVLQRDCGVRYNPAKIPADAVFTTEDTFIHGIVDGLGGTCANMPVVYVAVGRRLGYPLRLVVAHGAGFGHFFARWDDPHGERLNIEATAQGLSCA